LPTICKLFDDTGASIANREPVTATVSWRRADGVAQAFSNGRLIAELRNARPEWVEAGGIRIAGMEPFTPEATAFRAQAWQHNPI
jgi:hypothetical protein